MGRFFSFPVGGSWCSGNAIRLQGNRVVTRQLDLEDLALIGLEPRLWDRHCHIQRFVIAADRRFSR
jgi:hypothetical protein